ncbi:MAG: hypothetical protein OXD50_06795 [Chloroflexi bacterium]|nr:hypothetical protein [Chloroflexota bacterium]
MQALIQRLARIPGLTIGCITVLCWVLTAFAIADPDLSPKAALGGAKALFLVLAILMTILTVYRLRLFRSRD